MYYSLRDSTAINVKLLCLPAASFRFQLCTNQWPWGATTSLLPGMHSQTLQQAFTTWGRVEYFTVCWSHQAITLKNHCRRSNSKALANTIRVYIMYINRLGRSTTCVMHAVWVRSWTQSERKFETQERAMGIGSREEGQEKKGTARLSEIIKEKLYFAPLSRPQDSATLPGLPKPAKAFTVDDELVRSISS